MELVENLDEVVEGQEESLPMTQEQVDHFVGLIEYLCDTHNALLSAVSGEPVEDLLEVGVDELTAVLESLRKTASNFANALGMEINFGESGGESGE